MTLPTFLERITRLLHEASVPYMLTGSLAAAFYGSPRSTQDVDLVVEASSDGLARLAERIDRAGFYVSREAAREAWEQEGQFNAIDPETGWKADFIVRKSRPFSVSEFQRRRAHNVLGLELSLLTPEDLIVAKLEWAEKGGASDLQLRDVRAIIRRQRDRLDRSYIERWVRELDLTERWEEVSGPPPRGM